MKLILALISLMLVFTFCGKFKDSTTTKKGGTGNQNTASTAANPNQSKRTLIPSAYPATPGFEKFAISETGKFYLAQAFSVFNERIGYLKNVDYKYAYSDGRFDKIHSYNTDAQLVVLEFESAEKAQAFNKKGLANAIPAAQADKVKLPRCVGEKSDRDEFTGPSKLIKTFHHPNGSDITVVHSGDFNMWDCRRGSNRTEQVSWTDGVYYFSVSASPYVGIKDNEPGSTGFGRAEEFALDYLAALGQPVSQ